MTEILPPLAAFTLADLAPFMAGGVVPTNASPHHTLMEVGIDDVHGSIKHVLSRVQRSLYLSMFGFDDDELAAILWVLIQRQDVLVMITLDKSQSGGAHEKKLLDMERANDLAGFNSHVVIGQSETHQILHTKGFVADGIVGCHGSTNWSNSGEGTFVNASGPGGVGFKAQSNTHDWFVDGASIHTLQTTIIKQHQIAAKQAAKAIGQ